MELQYTAAQQAFRAEARAWLEANAPKEAPSGLTVVAVTRLDQALEALFED